jgi:hypothetical protein
MNRDSLIALIIASIITVIVSMPFYYSRYYSHGSKENFRKVQIQKQQNP